MADKAKSGEPDGWVLVPREPTEAMMLAGATDNTPRTATNSMDRMFETVALIYKAMIASSPVRQGEPYGG